MNFIKKIKIYECNNSALALILLFFMVSSYGKTGFITYKTKPNENLSMILYALELKPLYGKRGIIAQVIKLNKNKIFDNGNKIYPYQTLILPIPPRKINKQVKIVTENVSSNFSFFLKTSFFRIDSIDKTSSDKAIILSELSPEIGLLWNLNWSSKTSFHFMFSTQYYSFQKLENLNSENSTRYSFQTSMDYKINEFLTSVGAGITEELFPYSKSADELTLEKAFTPLLMTSLAYPFMKKSNASIGVKLSYQYLFSQETKNYDIQAGNKITAGLYFTHLKQTFDLFYSINKQDTSLATKDEKYIGIQYQVGLGK